MYGGSLKKLIFHVMSCFLRFSSIDDDKLMSFENLDRASPDLWPEKSKM